MGRRKPILSIDFDGVIHSYESGWKGARIIPDPPVEGAIEFLLRAVEKFEVHIFSSRSCYLFGRTAMRTWLYRWAEKQVGMGTDVDDALSEIKWPKSKPPALVTIDDRAITFEGIWPDLERLLAFKPWNRKGSRDGNDC